MYGRLSSAHSSFHDLVTIVTREQASPIMPEEHRAAGALGMTHARQYFRDGIPQVIGRQGVPCSPFDRGCIGIASALEQDAIRFHAGDGGTRRVEVDTGGAPRPPYREHSQYW